MGDIGVDVVYGNFISSNKNPIWVIEAKKEVPTAFEVQTKDRAERPVSWFAQDRLATSLRNLPSSTKRGIPIIATPPEERWRLHFHRPERSRGSHVLAISIRTKYPSYHVELNLADDGEKLAGLGSSPRSPASSVSAASLPAQLRPCRDRRISGSAGSSWSKPTLAMASRIAWTSWCGSAPGFGSSRAGPECCGQQARFCKWKTERGMGTIYQRSLSWR